MNGLLFTRIKSFHRNQSDEPGCEQKLLPSGPTCDALLALTKPTPPKSLYSRNTYKRLYHYFDKNYL